VTTDQWNVSTVEIARLMGLANGENEAIRKLQASLAEIRQVRAAKAASRAFTLSELGEEATRGWRMGSVRSVAAWVGRAV
jgi:hypothetical protein